MKPLRSLALLAPACLFAGCLMSRLDTTAPAGNGGSDSSAAGMTSSTAGKNAGAGAGSSGHDGGEPSGGEPSGGSDRGGSDTGGSGTGGKAPGAGGNAAGAGGNAAGAGGSGPSILDVQPSAACDKVLNPQALGSFVKYTIGTSGTKGADATGDPGPWSFSRDYYVWLPADYDYQKRYPVVIQLTACGGIGNSVYSLDGPGGGEGVDGSVIRVGISPPPDGINHAINPNVGCYDDYEGDDSVEVTMYQAVIDALNQKVCYDKNRVFVNGDASGSTLSNQLLCHFAGTTDGYAIRGSITNAGTWRTPPSSAPTCSDKPVASIFVHEIDDPVQPFDNVKLAINRALTVSGCSGINYDTAPSSAYKIGASDSTSCKKMDGCAANYPVVVCALPGKTHDSNYEVVNPAASTLIGQLAAP
jgi:poly(3-hydroxybutyrate) depolymerase